MRWLRSFCAGLLAEIATVALIVAVITRVDVTTCPIPIQLSGELSP
jgi:hypothetical protein